MDGGELQCTEVEKHLGVFVEKDLTYEQHINKTVTVLSNKTGMITHCIQYKPKLINAKRLWYLTTTF